MNPIQFGAIGIYKLGNDYQKNTFSKPRIAQEVYNFAKIPEGMTADYSFPQRSSKEYLVILTGNNSADNPKEALEAHIQRLEQKARNEKKSYYWRWEPKTPADWSVNETPLRRR